MSTENPTPADILTLRLYRVALRLKETDKRKNSTCHEYTIMAGCLDEAKALAVAEYIQYAPNDLEKIAAVGGHAMGIIYKSDIYGSKHKELKPDTLPSNDAIQIARERLTRINARLDQEEAEDNNALELTKG